VNALFTAELLSDDEDFLGAIEPVDTEFGGGADGQTSWG
jgi:hypothetical protein